MMFAQRLILVFGIFTLNMACNTETPKLVAQRPVVDLGQKEIEVEPIVEVIVPESDILFVIDNSGSMSSFQANLSNNIDEFINALTVNPDLDWRIAVTTSNMEKMYPGSHGKFYGSPTVVSRTTPNMLKALKYNLKPGANQDLGLETFFDPIRVALSPSMLNGFNKGFLRPNAKLVVIIITDSDDQGQGKVQDAVDNLINLKQGNRSKLAVYSGLASVVKSCGSSGEPYPNRLLEFTNLIGGSWFNLCDIGFSSKIKEIGEEISQNYDITIILNRRPKIETVQVWYGSMLVPSHPETGWVFDIEKNTISIGPKFDFSTQPQGTKFKVVYTPAG